ncbi:XRE family transcriptional regulator [Saccharopolyspora terrae]|uniref:XRE family transcriptional regulator n=1 Tax=Saccharopolyspora terrae TaxID=2530384 RepID=A0A4R4VLA8_9PSEU|nr:helix-turn-helix transcriptional regulator [Saccharopolyspora terrae]TDD03114.1 XRE family transcriptional regulator [Saccharopolyspora terrae]
MADDWAAVAKAISARLEELGMTQLDAAAKSKVAPATIRELQYNKVPRRRNPRTLEALSEALDWPADYLSNVLAGTSAEPHADEANDPVLQKLDDVLEQLHELRTRVEAVERRQEREDEQP